MEAGKGTVAWAAAWLGLVCLSSACATAGGEPPGFGEQDSGTPPPGHDAGHDASGGDGGSVLPDTGGSPADTGGGTPDVGGTPDTGGGQPDSGSCSITSTSPCAAGAACCPQGMGNTTAVCMCTAGTATQGQTCSNTVACAPGYVCIVATAGATTGKCQAWCVYPNGSCASGTCTSLQQAPVIGGVTYGACQ
jgi:hypothetical protein